MKTPKLNLKKKKVFAWQKLQPNSFFLIFLIFNKKKFDYSNIMEIRRDFLKSWNLEKSHEVGGTWNVSIENFRGFILF